MKLRDKVAIVTGGGRGIGRALSIALAQEGVIVGVLARSANQVEGVVAEIEAAGGRAIALVADVTDPTEVDAAVAYIQQAHGPVDILVNNAGLASPMGSTAIVSREEWRQTLDVNVWGVFNCTRAVLDGMLARGWGRIYNITSGAGLGNGIVNASAYSVTKAAVNMFSLNLADEVAGTGVTVNALRPGRVDSDMQTWIRERPRELVGDRLKDEFVEFYTSGRLFEASQPAAYAVQVIASNRNGELVKYEAGLTAID
jgi:NAD(P)-dependent dehydrogenase (short-subunit alcohol dehydrogenase family)